MRAVLAANAALVLAGLISFALMGAGQSLYGPALPAVARAFGLATSETGLLVSAHWVGAALGVAVMYLRGDHVTPRMGLGAMAAGSLLVASMLGWWSTLAGAVVVGLGYGISTVIFNRRFLLMFGEKGPSMLAFLNAVFGLGAIGAPLVFVAVGSDVRLSFLIVAALAAATLLIARAPAPLPVEAAGPSGPFRPRAGILCFGAVAIGIEACLIGLGPVALIGQGQGEERAAQFLSMFFVSFLIARLLLVAVAGMLPPFRLLIGALAGASLCALGSQLTGQPWFFVAIGACAGVFFPAFYVTAVNQMGHDPRVGPTVIAAGLVGGILSPLLLAALMAQAGDGLFFGVVAAVTGATSVVALIARRRMARARA